MPDADDKLKAFFEAYARRMNDALADPSKIDAEATAAAFANCFIEASPAGINCGKNDSRFLEQIPKGFEFYRNIGTISMKITGLEITELDDLHSMAKVHWDSRYAKPDDEELQIDFDVFYFVQFINGEPKIFAYITGDEKTVLTKHGLI